MSVTREERTRRLQADRAAAAATGRRLGGNAPYGWRSERGQLVQVPAEQATRWLVLHLAGQGWSVRKIADQLDALAIAPRTGEKWHPGTVHRITRTGDPLADTG